MILVEAPDVGSIDAFIRAVGDRFGRVHVVSDTSGLEALPAGALVIFRPKAEDAEWLNLKRPWFRERGLRTLIWAPRELAGILRGRAPDWFDWISHHVVCPPTEEPPLTRARALRGQGRFAEAEAVLRGALGETTAGERLPVIEALGDLLGGRARYADAEALYREAIAAAPELAEALQSRLERVQAQAAARASSR